MLGLISDLVKSLAAAFWANWRPDGEKKKSYSNEAGGYEGVENFRQITDTEFFSESFQKLQSQFKLRSKFARSDIHKMTTYQMWSRMTSNLKVPAFVWMAQYAHWAFWAIWPLTVTFFLTCVDHTCNYTWMYWFLSATSFQDLLWGKLLEKDR